MIAQRQAKPPPHLRRVATTHLLHDGLPSDQVHRAQDFRREIPRQQNQSSQRSARRPLLRDRSGNPPRHEDNEEEKASSTSRSHTRRREGPHQGQATRLSPRPLPLLPLRPKIWLEQCHRSYPSSRRCCRHASRLDCLPHHLPSRTTSQYEHKIEDADEHRHRLCHRFGTFHW